MGLYRRKDSKVWWMSFTVDGRDHCESTRTDDKSIAQKIYDILKGKIALDQWHPETVKQERKEYTFKELAEKYQEWMKGRHKSADRKMYTIKGLLTEFGDRELSCFTVEQLERYQSKRLELGNGPRTANMYITTTKAMFTKALDWNMVSEQILKQVRKVKMLPENNKRLRYLCKEECRELVNVCDPHLQPIVITALNTGMRRGEILGLQWDKHVDLKHGFILLDKTKNGQRREIPINDTLRATLLSITRRLDIPYVFFDKATGKPYAEVKKSFASALRRAKITDFHFHDLRHTFASHLVMAGVDITTVKELLGHKTLTMTLRYAHLAPAHKVDAVRKFDKYLNTQDPPKEGEPEADYYVFTTVREKATTGVGLSR